MHDVGTAGVSEIVLAGVTVTRRSDCDWLYRGVGRFFPEAWSPRVMAWLLIVRSKRATHASPLHI